MTLMKREGTPQGLVSLRLKEKDITPYVVELPVKDVNIFFKRQTPEEFEELLKKPNSESLEQSEKVSKRSQSLYRETDHGFIVGYGERLRLPFASVWLDMDFVRY